MKKWLILLLLAGCNNYDVGYLDKVKVKTGFYKGQTGTVNDFMSWPLQGDTCFLQLDNGEHVHTYCNNLEKLK